MKKITRKFKFYSIILIFFIFFIFILSKTVSFKVLIYDNIWSKISDQNQLFIKFISDKEFRNNFKVQKYYNDYNTNFLPFTQFQKLIVKKKKLKFLSEVQNETVYLQGKHKNSSFNIELIFKDEILITDNNNSLFFMLKIKNLLNSNDNFKEIKISSNLQSLKILDTLMHKNQLYISYLTQDQDCKNYNIASAIVNKKFLKFNKIFHSDECGQNLQGGRLQFYNMNNKDYLLFTTGNNIWDQPDFSAQNDKSIFGKTLYIDPSNGNHNIFSLGHRNPQGLFVENDLIISTEHGPYGGDEINKIILGENYGWPISSEGDHYNFYTKKTKYPVYKKNHKIFKSPIFSFIPSIGISEIIKLPNNFSTFWQNNFLIGSLNKKSLFRTKFDQNYEKLIFVEEIYIGERIRDLKYHHEYKLIFLALENESQIGILSNIIVE